MPDPWEYPWYAAWDLAFHCVAIARVDPGFAKEQLLLLLREWYMHPNGQIPAYEWAFGDVNPPVHAWAALRVFEIDGGRDFDFLARVMHKLLLNFTWWVNRKDADGNNVFEGGFLGPGQRRPVRPVGGAAGGRRAGAVRRHRLDGDVRAEPAGHGAACWPTHDPVVRGHRDEVLRALRVHRRGRVRARACGTTTTRSSTTCCALPDGSRVPLKVRSVVGLLPLAATTIVSARRRCAGCPSSPPGCAGSCTNRPEYADVVGATATPATAGSMRLLSMVGPDQLVRILAPDARRGRVPVRRTACARCPGRTWTSRSPCTLGGQRLHRRLRAGRVDQRPVRRQLQLARPDLVPGQLPADRGAAARSPRSSATTCWSSTRPAPASRRTLSDGRRRPVRAG